MLSKHASINIKLIYKTFGDLGKNTLYILIVHELFSVYIYRWVMRFYNDAQIYHLIIYVIIQVIIGVIIGMGMNKIKNIFDSFFGKQRKFI